MLIRVRGPEGTLRIKAEASDKFSAIKEKVEGELRKSGVEVDGDVHFYRTQRHQDAIPLQATIASLSLQHGDMVFINMKKLVKEAPPPLYSPPLLPKVPPCQFHGANASCVRCQKAMRVVVTRHEEAKCSGVELDGRVAASFMVYPRKELRDEVARVGVMFGRETAESALQVECIYEPPQRGWRCGVKLEEGRAAEAELEHARALAGALGLKMVGIIISRTPSMMALEYELTASELLLAAHYHELQGTDSLFAIVSGSAATDDEGHEEYHPFELSPQIHELRQRKYFLPHPDFASEALEKQREVDPTTLVNFMKPSPSHTPAPAADESDEEFDDEVLFLKPEAKVQIGPDDVENVESSFLFVPLAIRPYESMLNILSPVENRRSAATKGHLKSLLLEEAPMLDKVSDFHFLLWIAQNLDIETAVNMAQCAAARQWGEEQEGFMFVLNAFAES
eukprot:TRINITY_DN3915_c2_g1_i2.p1 TRINITY_DN3915_c2_g1~~TRINITY_DN3915_c2_g1_i2.p1  ORF type:complete len:452 (+),score=152.10 TRINITY_DN3915_c2_g1_i2:234-1589(+)